MGSITGMFNSLLGIKYNDEKKSPMKWLQENKGTAILGGTILGGISGGAIFWSYFLHQRGNIQGAIKTTHMKEIQRLQNRMNNILADESMSDAIKEAKLEEAQGSLQELIQELNKINRLRGYTMKKLHMILFIFLTNIYQKNQLSDEADLIKAAIIAGFAAGGLFTTCLFGYAMYDDYYWEHKASNRTSNKTL